MSVDANTGNAFLDSYARQINRLEKDPNATPEYDAALEKRFNEIKAQILGTGDGGGSGAGSSSGAHGSSGGSSTSTHGTGSSGSTGSTGSTGPSATGASTPGSSGGVTPPASVPDSVHQITSTAGPEAAAAVQKIADGAAASIDGPAGAQVAATAAQAGATAAQHVIDSGGTPAEAAAAATSAAQAAVDAGAAGGPAAAANVANTVTIVDPAAIAAEGARASAAVGGGAAGDAAAAAATEAGYAAAATVIASGGTAADAAAAATAAAGSAADAAVTVIGAGGSVADAVAAAGLVATAAGFGGAAAAEAAAAAVATGGLPAAQSVVDAAKAAGAPAAQAAAQAAKAAFDAAGGTAGGAAATTAGATAAKDAAFAAKHGGAAAAQSVADAAAHGGVAAADDVATVISMVTGVGGGSAADAATAAKIVADAYAEGGAALANELTPVINEVALLHGSAADMTQLADAVTAAYTAHGIDGAHVVSEAARQTFERLSPNILNGGGGVDQLRNAVVAVSRITVDGGVALANEVLPAINLMSAAGASSADMIHMAGITHFARADGGQAGADAVINTVANVLNSGGSVADVEQVIGQIGQAARAGGGPLATDVASITGTVLSQGGDITNVNEAIAAIKEAFLSGSQAAADAVVRAAQGMARAGGNGLQIAEVSNAVSQMAHAYEAEGVPLDGAEGLISDFADFVGSQVRDGNGPAAIIQAVNSFVPTAPSTLLTTLADKDTVARDALSSPSILWDVLPPFPGMPNPPSATDSPPPPAPGSLVPPAPADFAAEQKLVSDINANADRVTILSDAAQLAIAAAGSGDTNLETTARNIGNSEGNGTYSKDDSLAALNAASGAPSPQGGQGPTAAVSQPNATGSAYLKLENDVEHGADPQTLKDDAQNLKALAQKDGNSNLADAAGAVISGIDTNTYSQVGAEEALMNNGATNVELGFSPPARTDETTAYQKLLDDVRSKADKDTILNDVLSLSAASIKNGDFGLSEAALDFGDAVRQNMNPSLQPLLDAAPGTPAASLPPATAWTSDPTAGDPAANWD